MLIGEDQGDQEMPPCVTGFVYVRRRCQVFFLFTSGFETGVEVVIILVLHVFTLQLCIFLRGTGAYFVVLEVRLTEPTAICADPKNPRWVGENLKQCVACEGRENIWKWNSCCRVHFGTLLLIVRSSGLRRHERQYREETPGMVALKISVYPRGIFDQGFMLIACVSSQPIRA